MTNVEGARIASEGDERVANNTVRHQYRVLTEVEKKAMISVKDAGLMFIRTIELAVRSSREQLIAVEKVEEAVMWAVKGLTNG
jgi:hypothetical protein